MTARPACPDWRDLAASRDREELRSGESWLAALDHLDAGCRACRDAAYSADPTLVFRRVPAIETTPDEVADLTASVRAMIRAGRVDGAPSSSWEDLIASEPAAEPAPLPVPKAARSLPRWRIASLAASLVALLLGTSTAPPGTGGAEPAQGSGAPLAASYFATADFAAAYGTAAESRAGDQVEIETLDRPSANVYQFDDPNMAVVLIVDAGLDV